MAWGASPVASLSAALNGGGTSGAADTTGADTLFPAVVRLTGDTVNLTDSKSNSYGAPVRTQADVGGGGLVSIDFYRKAAATVGSGHTWTLSGGTFAALAMVAWTGGAPSSIDDQVNSAGGGGGATTLAAGSITPGFPNTLVLAAIVCSDGADPSSINGGFTIAVHLAAGGANFGVGIAYLVQTTETAANPTWTLTSGATYAAAIIANFKTAAGGGGRTTKNTRSAPLGTEVGMGFRMSSKSRIYVPARMAA